MVSYVISLLVAQARNSTLQASMWSPRGEQETSKVVGGILDSCPVLLGDLTILEAKGGVQGQLPTK